MGFQGSNYDPGSKVVPLFILGYPTINEKPCASSRRSGGDLGTIIIIVIVIIINTRNERNRRTSWMKVHNEKRNERPHEEHFAWPFSLGKTGIIKIAEITSTPWHMTSARAWDIRCQNQNRAGQAEWCA